MTTNNRTQGTENAAWVTSVVFLAAFAVVLGVLLVNSGVAKTPEQAATLRATFAPTSTSIPPTLPPPTVAQVAAAPSFDPAKVAAGQDVFNGTCFACHGMNAHGIPGLGKDLIESSFVHSQSDDELVAFIAQGRAISDPANTTGIAMPARGGNPALTDAQLADVVTYIRSLTAKENGGAASAPAAPPSAAQPAGESTPFSLPIDSVLNPSGPQPTSTPFTLPIDSVLTPLSEQPPAGAATAAVEPTAVPTTEPTLRPTPAETEVPFALPIDSVLTPSGS